ncbi:MAG: hypothetical protein II180_11060, partial [Proteobacteria bacterium]|nr:hypothetical protein [Pseudomonadota bacterium]
LKETIYSPILTVNFLHHKKKKKKSTFLYLKMQKFSLREKLVFMRVCAFWSGARMRADRRSST